MRRRDGEDATVCKSTRWGTETRGRIDRRVQQTHTDGKLLNLGGLGARSPSRGDRDNVYRALTIDRKNRNGNGTEIAARGICAEQGAMTMMLMERRDEEKCDETGGIVCGGALGARAALTCGIFLRGTGTRREGVVGDVQRAGGRFVSSQVEAPK